MESEPDVEQEPEAEPDRHPPVDTPTQQDNVTAEEATDDGSAAVITDHAPERPTDVEENTISRHEKATHAVPNISTDEVHEHVVSSEEEEDLSVEQRQVEEIFEDAVEQSTIEPPAKLGAGFGPHGSTARAYFLMFLQATLAVLAVGLLTGGCKITVHHGADHISKSHQTTEGPSSLSLYKLRKDISRTL